MITIRFENSGQPFREWDLDARNRVIACRPAMAEEWLGAVVLTKPVPGCTLEISRKGDGYIRRLVHRVESVTVSTIQHSTIGTDYCPECGKDVSAERTVRGVCVECKPAVAA